MHTFDELSSQCHLIDGLTALLKHRHGEVTLYETHLSWVLVAGGLAYKVKKAVRFDFVDFSTLEKRRHYCHEEVRLNRRLAPDLYLGVEPIGGDSHNPVLEDAGDALEYAVKMKAFPQECLWSERLAHDVLSKGEIDSLAERLAAFHLGTASATESMEWGNPAGIRAVAHDNLSTISSLAPESMRPLANELAFWTVAQLGRLQDLFQLRKQRGFIRDCHGDLHARNILTFDHTVEVFDCIDFNETLRWIDVINDIAFILMDVRFYGRPDLAARLLNRYLERTGDYEGVQLLRYYTVQRAAVRCKVALLRAVQQDEALKAQAEAQRYLELCVKECAQPQARVMITFGYSGSGKSTFAERLVECSGAMRLRSDVERKRMAGMLPSAHKGKVDDLYAADMTERTYDRLASIARGLLASGVPVIVDASFLDGERRAAFARLAVEAGVPFTILELQASERTMRERLQRRAVQGNDPSDADVAILKRQLVHHTPLSAAERQHVVSIDAEREFDDILLQRVGTQVGLPTWLCVRQSIA